MERNIIASPSSSLEILIHDKISFAQKLLEFAKGGIENLEFFLDFDFTISNYKVNDTRVRSTYQILHT